MAGYVTKHVARVYDGMNKAAEALINGVFVEITADGVKKITATKDQVFRIEEKTTLWGLPAVVLNMTKTGANEVYFVENEWTIDENVAYDEAAFTCAIGDYVKMKRILAGEQLIMSVASALYASLAEGDSVNPANGGTVAKVTG